MSFRNSGKATTRDLLHAMERAALRSQPKVPHVAVTCRDTITEVLTHVPVLSLGAAAQVSTVWRDATTSARNRLHPALSAYVVHPIMASLASFRTLMLAAQVCKTWCTAARLEREAWRRSVTLEACARDEEDPLEIISNVPFVDKVLRVNQRQGLVPAGAGAPAAFPAISADTVHPMVALIAPSSSVQAPHAKQRVASMIIEKPAMTSPPKRPVSFPFHRRRKFPAANR